MQFLAICIVCFYVGLKLFNWVTGLHWLAEFSLSLSILGGVGLAIASNATPPAQSSSAESVTDVTASTESEPLTKAIKTSAIPGPQATQQKNPSISFTIHKNRRP